MASSMIQIKVDEQLQNEASKIYEKLGIDLSTAVQMFLKRSVLDNGIPFKMTLPKEEYKISQVENALDKIQENAVLNGTSEMTLEEINNEITETRKSIKNRG